MRMQMNHSARFMVLALSLIALSLLGVFIPKSSAWSNGGYSASEASLDYGTHDWIAQHALDFLPAEEKQFFNNSLNRLLYGTELPDNDKALDRVNDKGKHHVYFFANGTLQDDAAAVRAQEEYDVSVGLYKAGASCEAIKHLGIMSHYIADLGVYAHVMGASTAWGSENKDNHSDYEDKMQTRTNAYADDFSVYLHFDGTLNQTTAYNAVITLARDTTFDGADGYTCTWMDQHYNWSDPAFKNRAGESLNMAVNAVADVLHTFALENLPAPSQTATPTPTPTTSPSVPELPTIAIVVPIVGVGAGIAVWHSHRKASRKKA